MSAESRRGAPRGERADRKVRAALRTRGRLVRLAALHPPRRKSPGEREGEHNSGAKTRRENDGAALIRISLAAPRAAARRRPALRGARRASTRTGAMRHAAATRPRCRAGRASCCSSGALARTTMQHRARACRGDPGACFDRHWPLLPEEARVWFRAAITALSGGASPQAADAAGCEAALAYRAQKRGRRRPPGRGRFADAGAGRAIAGRARDREQCAAPADAVMRDARAARSSLSPRAEKGLGDGAWPLGSESRKRPPHPPRFARRPLPARGARYSAAGRGAGRARNAGAPPQLRHVRRRH